MPWGCAGSVTPCARAIPFFVGPNTAQHWSALAESFLRTSCKRSFRSLLFGAPAGVVSVHLDPDDHAMIDWLRKVSLGCPLTPLLAVIPFEPSAVRAAAEIRWAEIVFSHEGVSELKKRLETVASPSPRSSLLRAEDACWSLPRQMGHVLRKIWDPQGPPVTDISQLLRGTGISETVFRRDWARYVGEARPKTFLDWALLLRALRHSNEGSPKNLSIAFAIRVHETTLDRLSLRLTGRRFSSNKTARGTEVTLREFSRWANRTLSFGGTSKPAPLAALCL